MSELARKRRRNNLSGQQLAILAHHEAVLRDWSYFRARTVIGLLHEADKKYERRSAAKRALESLHKRGFLKTDEKYGSVLTRKGRVALEKIRDVSKDIDEQTWDKNFHICVYDIPVELPHVRMALYSLLVRCGFRQLQQSVWISPKESIALEDFIAANPGLKNAIHFIKTAPWKSLPNLSAWKKLKRVTLIKIAKSVRKAAGKMESKV